MPADRPEDHTVEQLVELLVYAPVGLALEAIDNLPRYIERGRSQVTIGRFLARTAARKGSANLESLADRFVQEAGQVVVDLFGVDLTPDDGDGSAPEEPVTSPIAGYDDLPATEIIARLDGLSPRELAWVAERERAGKNRVTVLRRVERLR